MAIVGGLAGSLYVGYLLGGVGGTLLGGAIAFVGIQIGRVLESPANHTDRAVSPVIGVVLMVAVTVILAAVVGVFAIDTGQSQMQDAPHVSASVAELDDGAETVTLRHEGGDLVRPDEFNLLVTVGDTAVEFDDADAGSAIWGPGETLTIHVAATANASVDADQDFYAAGSTDTTLDEGDRVSVRLLHVETGKTVLVLTAEVR